jgi:N-acetylglutamate synthase-like GNAT family acetyltransferase
MKYFQNKFKNIISREVTFTKEIIDKYYWYNYSFKDKKALFCSLKIGENILHIELLIFPDDMKSKGYGTKIINNIKEWAYQNDYHILELYAVQDSKEFWKKQKFNLINEKSNKMIYKI